MPVFSDTTFFLLGQAGDQPPASGMVTMVGMFIFIFAFMYIFTIRPQRIKEKKHLEAVSKLKKGDNVLLESGIYGEVFSVEGDTINIKVADKVVIKVHQRGIRVILAGESAAEVDAKLGSK